MTHDIPSIFGLTVNVSLGVLETFRHQSKTSPTEYAFSKESIGVLSSTLFRLSVNVFLLREK